MAQYYLADVKLADQRGTKPMVLSKGQLEAFNKEGTPVIVINWSNDKEQLNKELEYILNPQKNDE